MDLPVFCCPFPFICHGLEPGLWQGQVIEKQLISEGGVLNNNWGTNFEDVIG